MATVFERVRRILVENPRFGHSEGRILPRSSLFDDLVMDSLDKLEFIMEVESDFSRGRVVEISDEEADKIITVQDVVNCLKGKGVKDKEEPLPEKKKGLLARFFD